MPALIVGAGHAEVIDPPITIERPHAPPNSPNPIPRPMHDSVDLIPLSFYGSQLGFHEAQAQLTRTASTLSVDVTRPEGTTKHSSDNGAPNVTVAISGSSSSGKTTTALILAAIFDKDTISDTSSSGDTNNSQQNKRALCIHQDEFFQHKSACSMVTFKTRPHDSSFCEQSIKDDILEEYTILPLRQARTRHQIQQSSPLNPKFDNHPAHQSAANDGVQCQLQEELHENVLHESNDANDRHIEEFEGQYLVSGPDTDSFLAINYTELLKAVKHFKATGKQLSRWERPTVDGGNEEAKCVRVTNQMIEELKANHSDLIQEMQLRVAGWSKLQRAKNLEIGFRGNVVTPMGTEHDDRVWINSRICFVEGFLLYTMAKAPEDGGGSAEETAEKMQLIERRQWRMEHAQLSDEDPDVLEKQHLDESTEAMQKLMELFDIKIFLPTTKATAGSRRFSRQEYLDHPKGERKPGEMWKTQGYFENVVWRNYLKEHQWLVTTDGAPKEDSTSGRVNAGILVREEIDASVETTVKWAVDVILQKLEGIERASRKASME